MTARPHLDLMKRQRLVLATWQAADAGISARVLARRVISGDWRELTPRTVLTFAGEPSSAQLRIAGCLELGPSAVLAGNAAMCEWGWRGSTEEVDVIVPSASNLSRRRLPLWIHPRYGDPGESVMYGVPRTSAPRSILNAAAWARTDREASLLILSAAQQGLAGPEGLKREFNRLKRSRRAPLIRELIAEAAGGATSLPELDFGRMCRQRGLPEPRRQTRRRDAKGRTRYTDVEFDLPGGGLLIVEIDGAGHLDPRQSAADTVRMSALARATGAYVIRVQSWVLRTDPQPFFDELSEWLSQDTTRYVA